MAIDAIHPGEHIQEELDAMQISAEEFAARLCVPSERLQEVLKGERNLDGEMALRLGHFFGMTPEFWLKLQNRYDLHIAEQRSGELIRLLPTLHRSQAA